MHSSSPCPVCKQVARSTPFTIGTYTLRACRACRFEYLDPQPDDAALAAIYNHSYFLGEQDSEAARRRSEMKSANAALYLDALSALPCPPGTDLLEIGCGHGELLELARRRGFKVAGVEFSPHAAAAANRRLGAPLVHAGALSVLPLPLARFGALVAADVIEHVRDPRDFLMRVRELMHPGGCLLLITPSLDSWTRRLFRHQWMEYKVEHLSYFSAASLRALLEQCGFIDIRITPNRKVLTLDYLGRHFERFRVPVISPLMTTLHRLLPDRVAWHHLRIPASGLLARARKPP